MRKLEKTIARRFIILSFLLFALALIPANVEIGNPELGQMFHATAFNHHPFTIVGIPVEAVQTT